MSRSHSQHQSDLSITDAESALIGARIRQLRGLESQTHLAGRIGITREHLSRIEGGAQPGTEILRRLAQVTGASLDFLVLGAGPALREGTAAAGSVAWEAALESLLAGTALRWPRAAKASRRRADRAWQELPEERRDDVRAFVQRIAVVAVAIEALLPPRAAKPVIDALGETLATLLVDRIVAAGGGPRAAAPSGVRAAPSGVRAVRRPPVS